VPHQEDLKDAVARSPAIEIFSAEGVLGSRLGDDFYFGTEDDRQRIRRYSENEKLMDVAKHEGEFSDQHHAKEAHWIPVDFFGMLARLMRHYTFGPAFRLEAQDVRAQPHIDRIFTGNRMLAQFREAEEAAVSLGDAVFRIDLGESREFALGDEDEGKQAIVRFVRPHFYFPEPDLLDRRKVAMVTLAWILPLPPLDGMASGAHARLDPSIQGGQKAVLREIHRPGFRQFVLNRWTGDGLGEELPLESLPALASAAVISGMVVSGEQPTGIDEIPIVHIAHNRKAGEMFGRSEFDRVRRVVGALENRISQEDEVLEKHARPKLIVGPGLLDNEGRVQLEDFDVIEIDPAVMEKAVKPEYLTWDMQINAIQHAIDKLEEYFFITTETSPASFGLERDGSQVESARALRFKAHRTVNKVEDRRDEWSDAIRAIFRIAQKMEEAKGTPEYAPSRVTIRWPDPIIEDDDAEFQNYGAAKAAGLVSRKRALMDMHDLSPADADAESERILEDMRAESEAMSPSAGTAGIPDEDLLGPEAGGSPPPAVEEEEEEEEVVPAEARPGTAA
jgi:hypothetical protein